MTRNSNQLQNHPKFITVHGIWVVMIGDITNKWSVSLYEYIIREFDLLNY